ncbi:hypothetical protein GL4_2428 [Methyloceanibacter caenitepidi]|uniref:Uncharacterized protein n=1 Tax=Methyloceanibacter caenitepidi TaxID=1384459 RepID=A0A0A8K7C4_9HYPH|nr:hypothetical protein GL4_2428 [Methyloceanibacter caenitepidi]
MLLGKCARQVETSRHGGGGQNDQQTDSSRIERNQSHRIQSPRVSHPFDSARKNAVNRAFHGRESGAQNDRSQS